MKQSYEPTSEAGFHHVFVPGGVVGGLRAQLAVLALRGRPVDVSVAFQQFSLADALLELLAIVVLAGSSQFPGKHHHRDGGEDETSSDDEDAQPPGSQPLRIIGSKLSSF